MSTPRPKVIVSGHKRRKKRPPTTQDLAFGLYEALKHVLKDLGRIDKLIPSEVSRIPLGAGKSESDWIIISRKDDLLKYIQTICRDHLYWGGKLIMQGWTAEIAEKGLDQGNGRHYKAKGKFNIENW